MATTAATKPLRVLTMVDGIGTYGGGETLAQEIAMGLDRERFAPVFCVTRWEPRPEHQSGLDQLDAANVPFVGLERRSRLDLAPWRRLLAFSRRHPIDILHTHKFGSNCWGAVLASRISARVFVAHEHTWSFEGQPQRRVLDRELIARRADAFVAVSTEDRRRMIEVEGIAASKVRFIPNGISTPPGPDPGHDFRAELGIGPDQPLVGTVATLRTQKALDVLVRASARLKETIPNVRVVIVGGTDSRGNQVEERLKALIADLALTETVTMVGRRFDIPNVLDALDVAALSSDYEGSPLSVMEYMAACKPVVATRVGGVPDLIEDGVTGLLVEPQDPEGLSAALATVLRDPERAMAMGQAGHERRQREFSIESTTRHVEDLYSELHAARGG